jgi:hypothetical protein
MRYSRIIARRILQGSEQSNGSVAVCAPYR